MANVYVSKSGNDSGAGESTEPFLTLHKAFRSLNTSGSGPHQLIILDSGVYTEGGLGLSPTLSRDNVTIMALTGSDSLPSVAPTVRGSGSAIQGRAFYCSNGWIFRGLTFDKWIISRTNGVIEDRSGTSAPVTIEDCIFTEITGTCADLSVGSSDPGLHIIQRNKFYNINIPSSSGTNIIELGAGNKKAKIINNVFYDIQSRHQGSRIFNAAGPTSPANIISHNTFGTSSTEQAGDPDYAISAKYGKFEYNIMTGYDNAISFIDNQAGESNYNIYFNITGSGDNEPFGGPTGPTGSSNNQEIGIVFKGALVGSSADYRLDGTSQPAFDAAIGSTDVTKDFTGISRATLDASALDTGIFDIGAYELTGLYSVEASSSNPLIGSDFIINRIPRANSEFKRALVEGQGDLIGQDVDQVPFTTSLVGGGPANIRFKPGGMGAYKVNKG
tara:strand:- start:443 stop:1774 length:1332 start_codon:yes stop_codon:yes gene_type:complete